MKSAAIPSTAAKAIPSNHFFFLAVTAPPEEQFVARRGNPYGSRHCGFCDEMAPCVCLSLKQCRESRVPFSHRKKWDIGRCEPGKVGQGPKIHPALRA